MSKSSTIFEPVTIRSVEPFTLGDDLGFTEKDKVIIDFLLTWRNEPTHISGIERRATIRNRSGKLIRSVTKKHVGDRCKYMEKIGLMKHVVRKPMRGSLLRTPHYYLNDDIDAFQILVEAYLDKENPIRKLTFMQSTYLYSAVDKSIDALLYRWLLPDAESRLFTDLFLLVVGKRLQRTLAEPKKGEGSEDRQTRHDNDVSEGGGCSESVRMVLDALNSMTREEIETDFWSFFEELNIFTEEQKNTYSNIAKLSPTALHLLVFLPFPKLFVQYIELGIADLFGQEGMEVQEEGDQPREWRFLNRIIHELLFSSMMADAIRYPFLMMRTDKRQLLGDLILNAKREGLSQGSLYKLRGMEEKARQSDDRAEREGEDGTNA